MLLAACFISILLSLPTNANKIPVVFCDDTYGKYTANAGAISLTNLEFPIMSTIPAGTSRYSDLTIPKLLHPCYSLSHQNNYKNQLYDIFTYGDFAQTLCQRQCAHFLDASRFQCGDRRPPPSWQVGSVGGVNRKINCSNWDLQLTEKGKKDGIFFTFAYNSYTLASGVDYSAPYTLDNQSVAYLDSMFIKGFHIKPTVDPAKKVEALKDMESMFALFVERHPEIVHIAFGNLISFSGDTFRNESKYYAPRFELSDSFYSTLGKLPSLNSLSLSYVTITGKETVPSEMTKNLKSVGFYDIELTAFPKWIQTDILQFLEFKVTLDDSTDIQILDQLPALEHFLLTESSLSSIKAPFLKASSKLISLTLQCNMISSIAESAFDHLTELKFLNLAGNRLVSLPESLLVKMSNLLTLDLKSIDNATTIQTFDELSLTCQASFNPSGYYSLDSMPKIAKPENIMALDIRGQPNFLNDNPKMLKEFKNLELLNIGNLGLSTIRNLSLETLCNLDDLNLVNNPLDGDTWIGDEIFVNLNLGRLRLGEPTTMKTVPNSLVAFMRTSSQIMYSAPKYLNRVTIYRNKTDCTFDTISSATMFGYQLQNVNCEADVEKAIESIRSLEMLKMDNQCE